MKVFIVGEGKCGGCLWSPSQLYALADSQKEADELYKSGQAGLCGDCLAELLMDDGLGVVDQGELDKKRSALGEVAEFVYQAKALGSDRYILEMMDGTDEAFNDALKGAGLAGIHDDLAKLIHEEGR